MKSAAILLAAAFVSMGAISCTNPAEAGAQTREAASGKTADASVTVLQTWTMPDELQEISGMVWEDATHFACINDEEGILYRYDIAAGKVVQKIAFGEAGDYEDVTKVGDTYYILRSNARLFEVRPGPGGKPAVQAYDISVAKKEDMESLFYDRTAGRLLFMNKAGGKKGGALEVYAFDLTTKRVKDGPVATINLENVDIIEGKKGRKSGETVFPSALAVHPETGEFYILNGPHAGLLIADRNGTATRYIQLDKKPFPQPEGIAFSPSGDLYLSSEGGTGAGIIARVSL